jgi:hypothetical protein
MTGLAIDVSRLREFERWLDPQHPERSPIPARVLGYGEISTVFEIEAEGLQGLAFKRLPIFRSAVEMEQYRTVYEEYDRLLQQTIGIRVPANGYASFLDDAGHPVFYIVQRKLPYGSIGNRALHMLTAQGVCTLVRRVLEELRKLWDFNRRQTRVQVAIDGQISNWSIEGFDPEHPAVLPATALWYVDTSTPLFRVQGAEQLDPELFLRSAPSFLVWLLRILYLKDVVNRYYDPRLVVMDLVANFYKEQKADLIPEVLDVANAFFRDSVPGLGFRSIEEAEVRAYYREDAQIWSLYLAMRKVDRFLRTRIARQEYPYILPEKIQR